MTKNGINLKYLWEKVLSHRTFLTHLNDITQLASLFLEITQGFLEITQGFEKTQANF